MLRNSIFFQISYVTIQVSLPNDLFLVSAVRGRSLSYCGMAMFLNVSFISTVIKLVFARLPKVYPANEASMGEGW